MTNITNKKIKQIVYIIAVIFLFYGIMTYTLYRIAIKYEIEKCKILNTEWLSRVSLVDNDDVPIIDWVEDSISSKGTNSFSLLDKHCQDVKYIVHTTWPIKPSIYYWWKSRLGGDYFYTSYQYGSPEYQYEKTDSTLYIKTSPAADSWIYLPAKLPQSQVYALDFDYLPLGNQYETLQVDVRIKSLANRFKFVIRYNKDIKFDMCIESNFLSASNDKRWREYIKPLTLSQTDFSHLRIEIINDIYSFVVNEERVLNVRVRDSYDFGDYWCLMSWNTNDGGTPCEMIIKNFRVLKKH